MAQVDQATRDLAEQLWRDGDMAVSALQAVQQAFEDGNDGDGITVYGGNTLGGPLDRDTAAAAMETYQAESGVVLGLDTIQLPAVSAGQLLFEAGVIGVDPLFGLIDAWEANQQANGINRAAGQWINGEISDQAYADAINEYNSTGSVGGGGEITVSVGSVSSPSPGVVSVSGTIENSTASGESVGVSVLIDGAVAATDVVSVAAGQSVPVDFEVTGVASGTREVCLEV